MKTKLEILKETAEAYSDPNNRAIYDNECMYLTDDGKKCAIGRCCEAPKQNWVGSVNYLYANPLEALIPSREMSIETCLKDEYKGHEVGFWSDLQHLHDENEFFNKKGFSEKGMQQIYILEDRCKCLDYVWAID